MRAVRWFLVPVLVGGLSGAAMADFKNLQVLPKTMSKDDLKQYMKAQMIQLTNDINDKWMKGLKDADKNKVGCATCHQGHELPPKWNPPATPEKK